MKTLFLAINGTSVYGTSLHSGVDAVNAANEWWDGENEDRGEIDDIVELDIPDSADIDDFNDCADVLEYEQRADTLIDECN